MSKYVKSCIIEQAMTTNAETELLRRATDLWTLAFETSGALGTVALGCGDDVVEARALSGPRRHGVEFLPTVAALCKAYAVEPTALRRIFVSSGPGSFTGLRIGITAARMISLATGASIVAVPTLEIIAQNAGAASNIPDRVVVMLDAKRGRVYAAAFDRQDDLYIATGDPVEADPCQFLATQAAAYGGLLGVLGEGVLYHRAAVDASGLTTLPEELYPPRVETVYRLGLARAKEDRFDERRTLIPTYIRPPEAEEKWGRSQMSNTE